MLSFSFRNPMNDSIGPYPSPICLSRSVEVIPDSTNTESSDVDYNGTDNTGNITDRGRGVSSLKCLIM